MMPPTISLAAARTANGLDADDPAYERVQIAVAPAWLRSIWVGPVDAMALPRTVYVTQEWFDRIIAGRARQLLAHESVHVEQWKKYGRVGFLRRYVTDYVSNRIHGLPHTEAYRAIGFEKEASSRIE
jgi:hypothetical protein